MLILLMLRQSYIEPDVSIINQDVNSQNKKAQKEEFKQSLDLDLTGFQVGSAKVCPKIRLVVLELSK
jgi:hypothetical protein